MLFDFLIPDRIHKFLFPYEVVETKYQSIHQIPVMTLDKEIAYIPKPTDKQRKLLILHLKKVEGQKNLLEKCVSLRDQNFDVYLIPSQNSGENFSNIGENVPKGVVTLGKMVINGAYQHPLVKFLKKNSELYSVKHIGCKPINEKMGAFLKQSDNTVTYLKAEELEKFLTSGGKL